MALPLSPPPDKSGRFRPIATPKTIDAGGKIRAMITDDSAVVRRVVAEVLTSDPRIEVVGTAASGEIALARLKDLRPHVITLDMEMDGWSGLETLERIRAVDHDVRIVMFSSQTTPGAQATIDALAAGADDFVAKPAGMSLTAAQESLRRELLPRITQFFRWHRPASGAPPQMPATPASRPSAPLTPSAATMASHSRRGLPRRIDLVAIGVSTGGPNALVELLSKLPGDFPVPIVIVQHMPAMFTRLLAERLNSLCHLTVKEAEDGMEILPGNVLIAPGGRHMLATTSNQRRVVRLDDGPMENSCRPAVDPLFRSIHDVYGGDVLTVVLTGMGQDGMEGVKVLRKAGAIVIAQDEATSAVWGMPGAVVRAGLADAVLPLDEIAGAIQEHMATRLRSVAG